MLYHGGPGKSISREEIDYGSEVLSWFLKEGAGEVRIASVNIFSISGILGLLQVTQCLGFGQLELVSSVIEFERSIKEVLQVAVY